MFCLGNQTEGSSAKQLIEVALEKSLRESKAIIVGKTEEQDLEIGDGGEGDTW